jgi:ABC-type phosphate/phosphonate transport system ATPase subunit
MKSTLALEIKHLTKIYPNGNKALDHVDFSIPV